MLTSVVVLYTRTRFFFLLGKTTLHRDTQREGICDYIHVCKCFFQTHMITTATTTAITIPLIIRINTATTPAIIPVVSLAEVGSASVQISIYIVTHV